MPRIRTLKPDFFTSPDTAAVDFPVRIFYAALWCWADDFGIGETNLNGLLGFAFPDSDGFSCADLRGFCADVAQNFQVTFYTVRGRHYYYIPSWEKHQKLEKRTNRRKLPGPDDPDAMPDQRIYGCADLAPEEPRKSAQIGANSRLEVGKGTGEQGKSPDGDSRARAREEPPPPDPPDFGPNDAAAAEPVYVESITRKQPPHPSSAAKTVVRQTLGVAGYPKTTIERLAVQVGKLAREGHPDNLIRQSLTEWDHRSDAKLPEYLPTVLGDLIKQSRAGPVNGHPLENKIAGYFDDAASLAAQRQRKEIT